MRAPVPVVEIVFCTCCIFSLSPFSLVLLRDRDQLAILYQSTTNRWPHCNNCFPRGAGVINVSDAGTSQTLMMIIIIAHSLTATCDLALSGQESSRIRVLKLASSFCHASGRSVA